LQQIVNQQEGIFGPLQSISAQPPNNVLTLVVGPSPPADQRSVLVEFEDHPPARPGSTMICAGPCLVNSKLSSVAAFRPKPNVGAAEDDTEDDADDNE
jgi:hypothetical protein